MNLFASLIIPLITVAVGFIMFRREDAFDSFVRGAREGMRTSAAIFPTMAALMVALSMFRASGAADLLVGALSPICKRLGIPPGIVPLAVTRPISGSASTASFVSLLRTEGADSPAALTAAIIMGSSDTLVYVIAVYFGRTRVRHAPRAFAIGSAGALLCLFLSCALVRLFF